MFRLQVTLYSDMTFRKKYLCCFQKHSGTIYLLQMGLKHTATVVLSYGPSRPCLGSQTKTWETSSVAGLHLFILSSRAASVPFWRSVPYTANKVKALFISDSVQLASSPSSNQSTNLGFFPVYLSYSPTDQFKSASILFHFTIHVLLYINLCVPSVPNHFLA